MKYIIEMKKDDYTVKIFIKNKKELEKFIENTTEEELKKMKIRKF